MAEREGFQLGDIDRIIRFSNIPSFGEHRGFELAIISFEHGKKAIGCVSGVSSPIVGYVEQTCKCGVIHTEIA
jgi:hypothetical protein